MKNTRNFEKFLKYKYSSYVARIEKFASSLGAKALRNQGHLLIKPLRALVILIGVKLNKSVLKVIISYIKWAVQFNKQSNLKALVLYLKVCSVLLQKRLGGDFILDLTPLGMRVSHSRGIPRIIPSLHRIRIRQGDAKIIRLWLTLFALYRILEVKPKISFKSITKTGKNFNLKEGIIESIFGLLKSAFWSKIWPQEGLDLKWVPFSLYKSSPTAEPINSGWQWVKDRKSKSYFWKRTSVKFSSSFPSIISTIATWNHHSKLKEKLMEWGDLVGRSFDFSLVEVLFKYTPNNPNFKVWTHPSISWSLYEQLRLFSTPKFLGKLGTKLEAAGKLRVFAMVDPFTQWIFHPLHEFIFKLLREIPMDGTFDQIKPIKRLLGRNPKALYSFDLSSATDRLSISIQEKIIGLIIGAKLAKLWSTLLVDRDYSHVRIKWVKGRLEKVSQDGKPVIDTYKYKVGQPMGALSSWAMLALTHHFLIQYSYWKAYRKVGIFLEYAVLGDDVVIADKRVARYYLYLCRQIGLGVSLPKSIRSRRGSALEFAKRTFFEGKDVSPITLKGFLMAKSNVSSLVDFIDPSLVSVRDFLRVMGYGYKALSLYHLPYTRLSAHARLRDRIFTYFLIKDVADTGSWNQAMGRTSLTFVDRARIRGFQMGGFLAETPTLNKYTTVCSLRFLLKKLWRLRDVLEGYLDYSGPSSILISGAREPLDLKSKKVENWVEPFTWWLCRHLKTEKASYVEDRSAHTLYKPYLKECVKYLDLLEVLQERLFDLSERLELAQGADFFTEYIDIQSQLDAIPSTPFSKLKDPMLKSEWSQAIGFFGKLMRSKKVR